MGWDGMERRRPAVRTRADSPVDVGLGGEVLLELLCVDGHCV